MEIGVQCLMINKQHEEHFSMALSSQIVLYAVEYIFSLMLMFCQLYE